MRHLQRDKWSGLLRIKSYSKNCLGNGLMQGGGHESCHYVLRKMHCPAAAQMSGTNIASVFIECEVASLKGRSYLRNDIGSSVQYSVPAALRLHFLPSK